MKNFKEYYEQINEDIIEEAYTKPTAQNLCRLLAQHANKSKKTSDTQINSFGKDFVNIVTDEGTIFKMKVEFPSECKMKLYGQTFGSIKSIFPTPQILRDSCGDANYAFLLMQGNIDYILKVYNKGKIDKSKLLG